MTGSNRCCVINVTLAQILKWKLILKSDVLQMVFAEVVRKYRFPFFFNSVLKFNWRKAMSYIISGDSARILDGGFLQYNTL